MGTETWPSLSLKQVFRTFYFNFEMLEAHQAATPQAQTMRGIVQRRCDAGVLHVSLLMCLGLMEI